ncbi:Ff.00g099250.m01.CDS01 [Fusarium sp. VM40]|nr:Ff.00g099250.m01.CDS01 [Fusarium sp. VM40]
MSTMGTSNVGKTSPTQPVDDDFDASDWAINLNIWSFVPEFDQGFDEWLPADGQCSVQCPGSDHACESHSVTRHGEQSLPFNAWDVPEPESFDIGIEQILSQDADLGISSTTYDLPLEPPIIEPRFEPFPSESLDLFLRQLTPLPNTDPSPDKIPDTVPQWLDRQVTMDDLKYSHQTGPKPAGSRYISKKEIGFESQCTGSVGSTCTRCERLKSKVDEKLVDVQDGDRAQSSFKLFLTPTEPTLSLPKVVYFELIETQKLLVALRGEVDLISRFGHGDSLESLFDGNMLWHIDDKATFSPYSLSSSTIAVKRLATTAGTVAQLDGIVVPTMDAVQLDTFIDQRRPVREIEGLADVDRETITIAWRCAYWLAVLLNWDANEVYLIRAGRDALSLVEAKNLVLELAYSVAHRIQVLIRKLCHRAIKSINRLDESLDPVTICCALWMVFSATHKFEKRNFQAKSLKNLGKERGSIFRAKRSRFNLFRAKDSISGFMHFQLAAVYSTSILTFVSAAAVNMGDRTVLNASQLLWLGLVTDLSVFALLVSRPSEAVRRQKPIPKSHPFMTLTMKKMVGGQLITQVLLTLLAYFGWFKVFRNVVEPMNVDNRTQRNTFVFNTFVWLQNFNILNSNRLDNLFNVFEGSFRNSFLFPVALLVAIGQILIVARPLRPRN